MPPRPFPYPLKVGIDICRVARVKSIISKPPTAQHTHSLGRFLLWFLTWPERRFFWDRFKDYEHAEKHLDQIAEHLAGRWAAKEACRKACRHLGVSNGLQHIMILPGAEENRSYGASYAPKGLILRKRLIDPSPKPKGTIPRLTLRSKLSRELEDFNMMGVEGQLCEISISHDGDLATAVAIVPEIPMTWAEEGMSSEEPGPKEGYGDGTESNLEEADGTGGPHETSGSLHSVEEHKSNPSLGARWGWDTK
ncbi:hypothetical protein BCR34DRAFT_370681 [Clohesyomyces aquaticus]|uniref:Uncharacterized protein n=1 Tax=Clohesyomyces aquaticus TaxID=1231657 RepID=A0A1Y1ZGZ6_9PLEO|nr:hypothetical protein BCR34DRAFT_370681 [Clohesyomyces aquaticus]